MYYEPAYRKKKQKLNLVFDYFIEKGGVYNNI